MKTVKCLGKNSFIGHGSSSRIFRFIVCKNFKKYS